jgi:hypothetical protein
MSYSNVIDTCSQVKQFRAAALLGAAFLSIPLFVVDKASAQTGTLLAINEGESTLSIINPKTGKETARVAEGGVAGHEVVASFNGKTAYVPIYGTQVQEIRDRTAANWLP